MRKGDDKLYRGVKAFKLMFDVIKHPQLVDRYKHFKKLSCTCRLYCVKALRSKKPKSEIQRQHYHFIDRHQVKVIGGDGGNGCISFLRLFKNPIAGPDGGDGGNGGHIIFEANRNIKSLNHVEAIVKGEVGGNGKGKDMHGANGEHIIVQVPMGTSIRENSQVVGDLDTEGARFVAAKGGAGGKGNHFFLSNENRHPNVAELGALGEERVYILELKIVAHAGLVGFPNAGKSSLLRAISRARPKVASYPFTTLSPHVGIVHYDDYEQVAVADLPGLISGAHQNRGLGLFFLRHIERCVFLLYVVDLSRPSPLDQVFSLKFELEQYQTGLSNRPHAIIANKVDLPESASNLKELEQGANMPVFPISAKLGTNIGSVLRHIRELYDQHNKDKLQW
ncbi:mitochondrial ribosome-associated GTPase 2-like isoform X2 [Limulus polyphemus]|uniref:Mitochondrial ribosome-associated GTPase 2-like isoform X2 n=1 Tax=Limulus polyphemus TaxID=6850 RepID=A0ABM1T4T8_LIMPO|nr:mitochondrial ribosome-associated GTPase 2-like isoform X2 [Limulus polyphemus]